MPARTVIIRVELRGDPDRAVYDKLNRLMAENTGTQLLRAMTARRSIFRVLCTPVPPKTHFWNSRTGFGTTSMNRFGMKAVSSSSLNVLNGRNRTND